MCLIEPRDTLTTWYGAMSNTDPKKEAELAVDGKEAVKDEADGTIAP